jgi:hypothetical protein
MAQFAAIAFIAHQAGIGMAGEHEFDDGFTSFLNLGRLGVDHHPRSYRCDTGCQKRACARFLYQADSAGSERGQLRLIAECRDINT